MKKQKLLACLTALCMTVTAFAPMAQPVQAQTDVETAEASSTLNVIPKPSEYTMNEGTFTLGADAEIAVIAEDDGAAAELTNTGEYIAEVFRASTGYELPVVEKTQPENGDITLRLDPDGGYAEQAYAIDVTTDQVIIEAGAPVGIFYGVQTLRQIFPSEIESETLVNDLTWNVPCSSLSDEPEYGFRSMMLDVTRHFFTVDQVKRQLDMLSQYKINTLHMHMSDDQGWRLEIKGEMYGESLDKLRTIGAQTSCNTNGIKAGQYTQEEFKEIVAYANERHIQIIPEFDMPSHAWAALVSLNFLNSTEDGRPVANGYDNTRPYEGWDVGFNSLECRNEKTYEFIDEVFRQVSEISPSKYIHIGGDEAHVTSHDDYVYFMNRVTEIAKKYGKTPIGWQNYDTAVENPEGTVTQFWSTGNAKFEEGINYVVSPADHAYMDMKYDSDCPYGLEWATHNPVDDSYNWDPTDYGSKDQIVGVETCLFTETIATDEALDYMIYPRVLGHAEIGWTAKEDRSWDEYKTRLATHDARLELQGIGYKRDSMIWYNPVNFRMPMDEGSGTTIDAASGPYSGTMNGGVSWTEGKYGTALHLDGTSGYIDIGAPDVQDEWTIGMWVKAGDTVGTNAVLVSSSESEIKLDQWNKTGKVGITEAGVADHTFNYSAPKGEWVHLTFVGDSNGTTLYVNGEEQDHLDATIDGPMYRLGASSGSSITGYLNGSLDDVRFYTRALSADEVAEIALVPTDDETASEAAIAALQTMVDKAVALGSDDEALNAAIANAQAVLAKEAPTATEVVTALLDLSEAMQALNTDESTDALRADVQSTIDFINENILNDVEGLRPGKVQALIDAVQAAQNVVDNPDASADALKAANKAMTKAAQELWEIVTKAELEALIEAANGYLDGDYTAESLEALQAAITAAQAVAINDDATTAEVIEAITNLSDAIAGLESITLDTSALEHEIELMNEMLANLDNYVPSSVEGLQDKLDAAKAALSNAASQAEIDEATKTLREARLNARTRADVSALEELVAYVNHLDLRAYTVKSAEPVRALAEQANEMIANAEITQAEVDALAEELQNVIDELQLVSDATITTPDNTKDSTTAESTNTAAADMSGMMFALVAAAGAAALAAYRRKRS